MDEGNLTYFKRESSALHELVTTKCASEPKLDADRGSVLQAV